MLRFEEGLVWIQTLTVSSLVTVVLGVILIGQLLKYLVRNRTILAKQAQLVITTVSIAIGGMIGSFGVLIVLIILFPNASNWVVNHFIADATVWQVAFQKWVVNQISDSRAATAVGLALGGIKFGHVALGYLIGQLTKYLFSVAMYKKFHRVEEDRQLQSEAEMRTINALLSKADTHTKQEIDRLLNVNRRATVIA